MFHSYFDGKDDKFVIFIIVYSPKFQKSASLELAPPSNKRRTWRLLEEIR